MSFTFAPPSPLVQQQPTATQAGVLNLKPGIAFDFATGDLLMTGARDVQVRDQTRSLVQDCVLTLLTQQAAYPIFSRAHGCDWEGAMAGNSRRLVQTAVSAQLRSAMARIPGVQGVDSIDYAWERADQLRVKVTIRLATGGAPVVIDFIRTV